MTFTKTLNITTIVNIKHKRYYMIFKKALIITSILAQVIFVTNVSAEAKPHDFLTPLTNGANAALNRFLPKLDVNNACRPYTAVDQAGNHNGGLKDSGGESSQCSLTTRQQVYTRTQRINSNTHAVMYAYYFPKDNGLIIASIGHRHDWEHVVVFVENLGNSSLESIVGAAYSAHGGVSVTNNPNRDGKQIYINYDYNGSVTHSFVEGNSGSNTDHVLISYSRLSSAARNTLDNQDFGNAIVPFRNSGDRFNSRIQQAADALGY